ncbi:uncharacterized protein SCDLUD_000450 [Saccharomycodes ludwigii]|uniref:uncharacterized protein n=1 Tax=Saccharomycodes ludwigii TaxID=36035 RepID=UPI001E89263E|nr:hypothetical protein SCDLUD_000450 [Saccharomycodes ludwigii]KAH3902857.1 hypothetical protein SCDLUD_000450 [Saccharomycodes ludwigii]
MSFQNQYELAKILNQLEPQQLTKNVFFGPLNALTRVDFLMTNNIKFIISTGMPVYSAMKCCANIPMEKYAYVLINFDPTFSKSDYNDEKLFQIMCYNQIFSAQLSSFVNRALSTVEREEDIYNSQSINILRSNIITSDGLLKFEVFNDFITLCKSANMGNVLIVSNSGNDESLTSLLISHVMRNNCQATLQDSISYAKSLRPSVRDINESRLLMCNGLSEYIEQVKSHSWKDILRHQCYHTIKRKEDGSDKEEINLEREIMENYKRTKRLIED